MIEDILKRYCEDFIGKKDRYYVNKKFIPIPWFGNLEGYRNSDLKVVTMSINPSCSEFAENRFMHASMIRHELDNGISDPVFLKQDLDNYFNYNPYWSWFGDYERRLQEIDCSYTKGALHIDLLSAIPTDPIWRKLSDADRSELRRTDLTLELVEELDPDLIMVSCAEPEFFGFFSGAELIMDSSTASNRKLKLYKWNGRQVLFGSNCQGHPFRTVNINSELGDLIYKNI